MVQANRSVLTRFLILGGCAGLALPMPGQAQPLSVCGEPNDGPPWLYWKASPTGDATRTLAGFNVDLFSAAAASLGHTLQFRGDLPFSRCMKMVADRQVDFAIGAYRDAERERLFAFSRPYKILTPQVFLRLHSSLSITRIADLKRYKGCGMNGSSYAHYDLKSGDLDRGTTTYVALVKKLKAGHCDYFVEELEVIRQADGGTLRKAVDMELRHNDVQGASRPGMHLVAAKNSPAAALLPDFSDAVDKLQHSGELQRLWRRHAGE